MQIEMYQSEKSSSWIGIVFWTPMATKDTPGRPKELIKGCNSPLFGYLEVLYNSKTFHLTPWCYISAMRLVESHLIFITQCLSSLIAKASTFLPTFLAYERIVIFVPYTQILVNTTSRLNDQQLTYFGAHAPPATTLRQLLHFHIPTQVLFMES